MVEERLWYNEPLKLLRNSNIFMGKNQKGFTLIELLVVIAIIGILSSIVLVALRGARNKAKDARIISSMSQIRSMAEVLYTGSSYSDVDCTGIGTSCTCNNSSIKQLCDDILDQNSSASPIFHVGSEYCVQVSLIDGGSYCVDSTGYAGTTDIYCDPTFDCASD